MNGVPFLPLDLKHFVPPPWPTGDRAADLAEQVAAVETLTRWLFDELIPFGKGVPVVAVVEQPAALVTVGKGCFRLTVRISRPVRDMAFAVKAQTLSRQPGGRYILEQITDLAICKTVYGTAMVFVKAWGEHLAREAETRAAVGKEHPDVG
jgi:hypothetical protein